MLFGLNAYKQRCRDKKVQEGHVEQILESGIDSVLLNKEVVFRLVPEAKKRNICHFKNSGTLNITQSDRIHF